MTEYSTLEQIYIDAYKKAHKTNIIPPELRELFGMKKKNKDFDIVQFMNEKLPPYIWIGKYEFRLDIFSNHTADFRVGYILSAVKGAENNFFVWKHKFIKGKVCDFLTLTENATTEADLREALVCTYETLVKWKLIKKKKK